jgi:hypothetical protein
MLHALLSKSHKVKSPAVAGLGVTVAFTVAIWFAVVFFLARAEVFVTLVATPPLAILAAVAAPIIVFFGAFQLSEQFRGFALGLDLRLLAGIQAWRMGGRGFLALYAYGILPGHFAWPAGLGDMAIGISAPWIILGLMRDLGFAASKTFIAWNLFGIFDLALALAVGGFGPRVFSDGVLTPNATAPMSHMPLVLTPAFFVPLFIVLHLIALVQALRFARERRS